MATEAEKTNIFVRHMLNTHTLGKETIARHGTENAIFDDNELAFLREYCADPSKKDEIMHGRGMADKVGQEPGFTASHVKGSLVGYAIATGALSDEEVLDLREWFEKGGAGI